MLHFCDTSSCFCHHWQEAKFCNSHFFFRFSVQKTGNEFSSLFWLLVDDDRYLNTGLVLSDDPDPSTSITINGSGLYSRYTTSITYLHYPKENDFELDVSKLGVQNWGMTLPNHKDIINIQFIDDFLVLITELLMIENTLMVCGDFNIHTCKRCTKHKWFQRLGNCFETGAKHVCPIKA